jgi:dTDP-4-dehydrorhamnose reductase
VRTAWLFSPYGANFVRAMLSLNEMRDEVAVAARAREETSPALFGVFHMTGSGEMTRADFAEAIFAEAAARGRRLTRVKRITTADYPTPARRAANSRLDNEKAETRIRP